VPPSEYLPQVFGDEMSATRKFDGLDEANHNLGLMIVQAECRHVQSSLKELFTGEDQCG